MAWCSECDALVRWVVMDSGAHMPVDPDMVGFVPASAAMRLEDRRAALSAAGVAVLPAPPEQRGDDYVSLGGLDTINGLVCCQKRHDHREYRGGFIVTDKRRPKPGWRLFRPHWWTCPYADQIKRKNRRKKT